MKRRIVEAADEVGATSEMRAVRGTRSPPRGFGTAAAMHSTVRGGSQPAAKAPMRFPLNMLM